MIREKIIFENRLAHQSTTSTNKQWQWRIQAYTPDLRVDHHLWGDWAFMRTALFLALNWSLASELVSLPLTWQQTNSSKLIRELSRVYRIWASCLRTNACLQWSSNQGLSLLHTRMTLVVTKRPTNAYSKPQQDCQQINCYARADPALDHKLYSYLFDV